MPLVPGQVLHGRYVIQSLLGQGGMGSVYRAFDQTLNRPVAIKERVPDAHAAPQGLAQSRLQFQREAQVLANLTHPNLPRVTDCFSFGGNEYLVMDLIEGTGLDQIVRQNGAINEGAVRAWVNQVLDALIYIHGQNPPIIHRDIKPANIVLKPDGKVVLVDFGLVKLVDPSNPQTATAMRGMGTAEYAPLEQFSPGMHTDVRSDIYSLGATLYHLLAGQPPLDVPQRLIDLSQQPRLVAVNPTVSPQTEAAVQKAMEVYPQNRFQTVAEMKLALTTTGTLPTSASRTTLPAYSSATASVAPTINASTNGKQGFVWVAGFGGILLLCLLGIALLSVIRPVQSNLLITLTEIPTQVSPIPTSMLDLVPALAATTAREGAVTSAPTTTPAVPSPTRTLAKPTSTRISSSVVGTWSVTVSASWGSPFTMTCREDGTLSYHGESTADGTWEQEDDAVSFQINNFSFWKGTINGSAMSGTMYNKGNDQGTWSATRQ